MTRRDPLVLDRRLEPPIQRWLRADWGVERAWRQMHRRPNARVRLAAWLADGWHHVWLVAGLVVLIWWIFGGN